MHKKDLRALLSPRERQVFQKLKTPKHIQDFLDSFPINFEIEEGRDTNFSPRVMLQKKRAHCFEGAVFAVASLAYQGKEGWLLDLRSLPHDYDHVVALFKEKGLWGAISKTNHTTLRWRDPIYKTPRELAMSYFHEFYLESGEKTLRAYSKPFSLKKFPLKRWVTVEEDLDWLAEALDNSPHLPFAAKDILRHARKASKIEREALEIVEWPYPKNYKGL